jgi:hypothetical protein
MFAVEKLIGPWQRTGIQLVSIVWDKVSIIQFVLALLYVSSVVSPSIYRVTFFIDAHTDDKLSYTSLSTIHGVNL